MPTAVVSWSIGRHRRDIDVGNMPSWLPYAGHPISMLVSPSKVGPYLHDVKAHISGTAAADFALGVALSMVELGWLAQAKDGMSNAG